MAIAFDAVSTATNATDPTSLTWSHTTAAGDNRILIVGTSSESDTGGHTAQTVSGITYGSIVGSNLTSFQSSTDANSYATASITPTANNLIIASVTSSKSGTPDTPTLSGNGLTWVQFDQIAYDTVGTQRTTTFFRAMGSSPSSGSVTADFGGVTQTACVIVIDQFSGVDTSGTNGSGAIVQSVTGTEYSLDTLTITLGSFSASNNATYGVASNGDSGNYTVGSGFLSLGATGSATPLINTTSQWRNDNDTSVTFVGTAGWTMGGIAVEIKAANALQTLTKIRTDYITDNGTELWYLVAPATGANNIVVTMTAVVDGLYGAGLSFTGVDQSNPIDNHNGTTTTGLSISQSITTNVADAMIVNIVQDYNSAAVFTPDGDQTQRFNAATTGDFTTAGGTRLVGAAGSYTTTWTSDINDGKELSIVSLKPYVAPVASTGSTFLMMGV